MNPRPPLCSSSVVAVGLLLFGLASPASAKDDAETAQEKAAKKACALGDYAKGADILTDLFVATDNVNYIYNQARCYEQNNQWERAIARFREYLRKAKHLTNSERAETERHIAECEAALREAPLPAAPATPPAAPLRSEPPPLAAAPAAPPDVQPPAAAAVENIDSPPQAPPVGSRGRGLRIAGVVLGGVGVAAIGAGVGCTLKTQSISSNEGKNGATKAQEDERKAYETWGWVSYGVGAAALATGVVLYLVGWPAAESAQAALLPSVSSSGASLLLAGRF